MIKTEILKEAIIKCYYYIKEYFVSYLFPIIKETFIETKNYFISSLWDKIKENINEQLEMAIQEVEIFYNSASYEIKEKIIIDYIFDNIKLPLLLRPSKFIAKRILKNKIREFITDKLNKLHKLDRIL